MPAQTSAKTGAATTPAGGADPSAERGAPPSRSAGPSGGDARPASGPADSAGDGAKAATSKEGVDLGVHREFALEKEDWYQATFALPPPLKRGEPAPFDPAAAVRRLGKLRSQTYGWGVDWEQLDLPPALSREAAHFWLVATTAHRRRQGTMKEFAAKIGKQAFAGDLTADEAVKMMRSAQRGVSGVIIHAAMHLVSLEAVFDLILTGGLHGKQDTARRDALMSGWRKHVLPYLTEAESAGLKAKLQAGWDGTVNPSSHYDEYPIAYELAAGLGLHDELAAVVGQWADDYFQAEDWCDHYLRPQELILGLGSPDLVIQHWHRLRLRFRSPDQVRRFVACTRHTALMEAADGLSRETNKDEAKRLVEAFARVKAPEMAPAMLRLKLDSKAAHVARDWLDANVGNAAFGLVPVLGPRGKLGDAAVEILRAYKRLGFGEIVQRAVDSCEEAEARSRATAEVLQHEEVVYPPLDETSTPSALADALVAPTKAKKLPAWLRIENLPPVRVGEARLSDGQVQTLLQLLIQLPVDADHPAFAALHDVAEPRSLDTFAWTLFQLWRGDGFPSKDKWALAAVGHLGGDASALKLTPLVRAWPGESQHARAVLGLQALRGIGTSTALMQLSSIGQKLKFKGLKAKAQAFVQAIAQERGLTTEALEDRVIPDCGLDPDGRRVFDFGPRSFTFVLSNDLKAEVRDEAGKLRANLPKPGVKDDADKAEAAVDTWKVLKKQIKEVATLQAGRLEQAMVTGRRWSRDDFEALLVRHPLMTHLVQKVVWGAYDAKGARVETFRVTEERDYATVGDDAWTFADGLKAGIVHPLDLDDDQRATWGRVMADYELVSPFPQLERDVHTIEAGEAALDHLGRYRGVSLSAPTMVYNLEKLGWVRGEAMDAGCFDEHSKQYVAANVTAVVTYEGTVGMGYIDPDERLTVEGVYFCEGLRAPSGYGWNKEGLMKLGAVPAVVMSEVLSDLEILKSKAAPG